jgi:phosphinothricin acetyltransferase
MNDRHPAGRRRLARARFRRPGAGRSGFVTAGVGIRQASPSDAAPLLAIYRPFVLDSAVTFETEPPSLAAFQTRIERALAGWTWLVAEQDGRCLGYASATAYRPRPAYRFAVEVSAYVAPARQRQGVGRMLYQRLLPELAGRGFHQALAVITLPNPASITLHQRLGFVPVGTFSAVGWKLGRWQDVAWMQCRLNDGAPMIEPPAGPAESPRS